MKKYIAVLLFKDYTNYILSVKARDNIDAERKIFDEIKLHWRNVPTVSIYKINRTWFKSKVEKSFTGNLFVKTIIER